MNSRDTARFAVAMAWLLPIEGGWWPGGPSDPNPTMKGITQKVYTAWRIRHGLDPQSVRLISDLELQAIYRVEYWNPLCPEINWPLSLAVFDTSVNCGVGTANKLLAKTLDTATYIKERGDFYRDLAARRPEKAPNLPGWLARNHKLAESCGVLG